jgi:hypothetical protein
VNEEAAIATHSKTLHAVQRLRRLARRRREAELKKARLAAAAARR